MRASITAFTAALLLGAPLLPERVVAQADPMGVWNIRSRDMTDRATGGIRAVLLRIHDDSGTLGAEITSISNRFMAVEELNVDGDRVQVLFGSYEYDLRIDGDEIEGTVVSPFGTQSVSGLRQYRGLLYVGDEPEDFETTRPGVIGLASGASPPAGTTDVAEWIRSRVDSPADLALIVGRRAQVPVPFTNASDFERELLALAGESVEVVGVWVGDRLRILSIEAS